MESETTVWYVTMKHVYEQINFSVGHIKSMLVVDISPHSHIYKLVIEWDSSSQANILPPKKTTKIH